jgi:hypothetical protein
VIHCQFLEAFTRRASSDIHPHLYHVRIMNQPIGPQINMVQTDIYDALSITSKTIAMHRGSGKRFNQGASDILNHVIHVLMMQLDRIEVLMEMEKT